MKKIMYALVTVFICYANIVAAFYVVQFLRYEGKSPIMTKITEFGEAIVEMFPKLTPSAKCLFISAAVLCGVISRIVYYLMLCSSLWYWYFPAVLLFEASLCFLFFSAVLRKLSKRKLFKDGSW